MDKWTSAKRVFHRTFTLWPSACSFKENYPTDCPTCSKEAMQTLLTQSFTNYLSLPGTIESSQIAFITKYCELILYWYYFMLYYYITIKVYVIKAIRCCFQIFNKITSVHWSFSYLFKFEQKTFMYKFFKPLQLHNNVKKYSVILRYILERQGMPAYFRKKCIFQ